MSAELKRRSAIAGNKLAQYERMIEIRTLEEQINELFASGEIRGTTHLCIGQEALAVGMASVLRPTDIVSATYRGHGIALALGLSPESVLGEIMGKTVGCCGGVGGSMHLSNMELGLLPTSAIIGGGMPVAAGAALSVQTRGTDDVAVAVFGDGATNIGAFHETLNLAAIWNLPIVFICDNNVYGEYSRIDITTPLEDLHHRGESYRMPHYAIDGMDIAAVQEGIQKAVDHARSGKGPTFIEAKTYRFSGHSRADLALYRPEGELEKWQARDPIKLTEEKLVKEKIIDAAQITKIKEETLKVIRGVVEDCKSAPNPSLASMFQNIYTDKKGK
jgi:pyruvate dehydrogenase E1 component alpha subunit